MVVLLCYNIINYNLHKLDRPRRIVYKASGVELLRQRLFQMRMASLLEDDAGEKIVDEGQEERFVAVYQLSEVDVTHGLHCEHLF